jgi:hypothetical protein
MPLFCGWGLLKGRKACESWVLAASQKSSIPEANGSGGSRTGNELICIYTQLFIEYTCKT